MIESKCSKNGRRHMRQHHSPRYASNSLIIYTHFLRTLLSEIEPKSSLVINTLNKNLIEEFPFLPESQYDRKSLGWVSNNLELNRQNYELLYGEFPIMGASNPLVSKAMKADIGFNTNAEWYYIFNTIKYLSKNGLAIFPVIPAIFYPSKGRKF